MLWQIFLVAFVTIILWKLLKTEENDLQHVPGPPSWPIIGNALVFLGLTHVQVFDLLIKFPQEYGYRVVIKVFNRYILHIYNVEDIEIVLSHSRNIMKNKPYKFMQPWLGTGLLMSSGAKWHNRRKILTPTFHFDILKSFMRVFKKQSKNVVKELRKLVNEGSGVVDVMPFISDFMLYTICETAMGIQLDADRTDSKLKYKKAIMDIGPLVMKRLTNIWLHNDLIFSLHPLGKQFAKCLDNVHSFADSVIMKRKKDYESNGKSSDDDDTGVKQRLALLDLLLEAEQKGDIDLEGIREEVNTFMFEGHDTTATALTFGLMLLADHEEVQEKIFNECKAVLGDKDRFPNASDFGEMKYLEAVIKEILRLYPSVPFIGRQITEDFMLGDIKLKEGTEVIVHIYDVQRRKDLYPEPNAFKPERFLEGESRHPYAYVPFSAGPRNCIGQKFAKLEIKSVITEIIRNFRLEPLQRGARPALKADLVLRSNEPIYVKFVQR